MPVFLPTLKAEGKLDNLVLTICSVGSRKSYAEDDLGEQGWQIFAPNLRIYGFDADPEACAEANQDLAARSIPWQEEHIEAALSDRTGERTLYVTKAPMCSSLYPPNSSYLSRFAQLGEVVVLDFSLEIETITLDELCQAQGITAIDFLQIDVQGAELLVLQGAHRILTETVLALKTEVEFSPLYLGQPLFADLDTYVREQGFTLFDLDKAYRPRRNTLITSRLRPGQLLWGDAYYLRDPLLANPHPVSLGPQQILKLACIADLLEFTDYALELLTYLTCTYGQDPQYNCAEPLLTVLAEVLSLPPAAWENLEIVQQLQSCQKKS